MAGASPGGRPRSPPQERPFSVLVRPDRYHASRPRPSSAAAVSRCGRSQHGVGVDDQNGKARGRREVRRLSTPSGYRWRISRDRAARTAWASRTRLNHACALREAALDSRCRSSAASGGDKTRHLTSDTPPGASQEPAGGARPAYRASTRVTASLASMPAADPLADRPLTEPHPARLDPAHPRRQQILAAHADALAAGQAGYLDPDSSLFVLTAGFLRDRGFCCRRGCRHCPYLP